MSKFFDELKSTSPFARKVGGLILVITGALMGLLSLLKPFTLQDVALISAVVLPGLGLLGVGNVTDIFKKDKVNVAPQEPKE